MEGQDTVGLPEGFSIREASEDDREYLLSCVMRSLTLSVDDDEGCVSDLWMDTILSVADRSMTSRRMGDETFIAMDKSGTYAGSLWLGRSVDQFTCDDTGYVLGIFVEPELRGRGIGSALLAHAESWCREKGLPHISLNVSWHNENARKFYESHGYGIRSEIRRKTLYPL